MRAILSFSIVAAVLSGAIGSTYFWIEAELIGLVMTQLYPPSLPMLEPEFQTLVYNALQN